MSPDRPLIDVFNTSGVLVARLGDITGMPWGGGSYTLPSGTYGLWTLRDGTWMKGQVTMFYAWLGELTDTHDPVGGSAFIGPGSYYVTVEFTFPFGTINVPSGRIVTFDYDLVYANLTYKEGAAPYAILNTNAVFVETRVFRASLNGGAATDFAHLTGPVVTGTDAYTSVKLQVKFVISVPTGIDQTYASTALRIKSLIKIFAHEVNAAPTLAHITDSYAANVVASGDKWEKGDVPVTGGAGTDAGGYQGDGCVAAGTPIKVYRGRRIELVPVEALRPGDEVPAWQAGRNARTRVLAVDMTPNCIVYSVNGRLQATAEQKILARRGWVRVDGLRRGDALKTDHGWEPFRSRRRLRRGQTTYNPRLAPLDIYYAHGYVLDIIKV